MYLAKLKERKSDLFPPSKDFVLVKISSNVRISPLRYVSVGRFILAGNVRKGGLKSRNINRCNILHFAYFLLCIDRCYHFCLLDHYNVDISILADIWTSIVSAIFSH